MNKRVKMFANALGETPLENSQASNTQDIIATTQRWVENFVVGMNLCPFAKRELVKNKVRFTVTTETTESELLKKLSTELEWLEQHPETETTLLIHPLVLRDFLDYNFFLGEVDRLLVTMDLEGIFQVASFHPDYRFAGTEEEDVENYTNRSPFPTLHLLREDSLEQAIDAYPDVDEIPRRNIKHMNNLGIDKIKALFQALHQ